MSTYASQLEEEQRAVSRAYNRLDALREETKHRLDAVRAAGSHGSPTQPTDRAFRIGQTRNVQVHRFITKGTFEEKINALLETKKSIANMTVSAGETWLADMDDKQLGEVFGLDNTLV